MAEHFRRTFFGGGAKSNEGYVVRFNSRSSIEFQDDTGKVFVSAEGLVGSKSMAIYPQDMKVGSRNGSRLDDDSRRTWVLTRVEHAAAYLGWVLE